MVTSETGDYEDPGVPCLRGGRHAPDADIILPVVPQPRGAGERGDRGVRDPGEACVPSHKGNTRLTQISTFVVTVFLQKRTVGYGVTLPQHPN